MEERKSREIFSLFMKINVISVETPWHRMITMMVTWTMTMKIVRQTYKNRRFFTCFFLCRAAPISVLCACIYFSHYLYFTGKFLFNVNVCIAMNRCISLRLQIFQAIFPLRCFEECFFSILFDFYLIRSTFCAFILFNFYRISTQNIRFNTKTLKD